MFHEPASKQVHDPAKSYKTRLGAKMFFIYAIVYAGFVAINLVKPVLMESVVAFGLNLAVCYGSSLILFALVLAIIYNSLCGREEKLHRDAEAASEKGA